MPYEKTVNSWNDLKEWAASFKFQIGTTLNTNGNATAQIAKASPLILDCSASTSAKKTTKLLISMSQLTSDFRAIILITEIQTKKSAALREIAVKYARRTRRRSKAEA